MMKNSRPHVICLMMTSVDGRILTENWGEDPRVRKLTGKFEEIHARIGVGAWIVGRTTMEKDFTEFAEPVLKPGAHRLDRSDFVAVNDADSFAIAVDGHGKLGWHESTMEGDHVITILTEAVPDAYLAQLRDIGVSYVFAGADHVDLGLALTKLRALFGIGTLMLEGGGHLNGSFLNAGLVDELHQLILPIADGTSGAPALFEISTGDKRGGAVVMKLNKVEQIEDEVIWLQYSIG